MGAYNRKCLEFCKTAGIYRNSHSQAETLLSGNSRSNWTILYRNRKWNLYRHIASVYAHFYSECIYSVSRFFYHVLLGVYSQQQPYRRNSFLSGDILHIAWTLGHQWDRCLFSDAPKQKIICFCCFYVSDDNAYPILMFVKSFLEINDDKIWKIFCNLCMLQTVICSLLHFTGFYEFRRSVWITHLSICIVLIYLITVIIYKIIKNRLIRDWKSAWQLLPSSSLQLLWILPVITKQEIIPEFGEDYLSLYLL